MSTSRARELHFRLLVVDSHNDTIVNHIRRGNLSLRGEPPAEGTRHEGTVLFLRGPLERYIREVPVQIDFQKMREGGVDAAFFAVDVTRARKNHLSYAMDALGFFDQELEAYSDEVVLIRATSDIREAKESGKLAVVLVIENSDGVEGSLNILRMVYRLGVRSIGLTHNISTWAADGNAEARSGSGLTEFGVDLVREMNELGMLVDVSHISESGFWDVMRITKRPVIASHSNCMALCDHPRNLTDDQIRAVSENGGSIGITFVPIFVKEVDPTLDHLLEHIDYAVQIGGIEHVGLGSDFDGGGMLLKDTTDFPKITEGLIDRGYSDEDIEKILGANHLRVLSETIG